MDSGRLGRDKYNSKFFSLSIRQKVNSHEEKLKSAVLDFKKGKSVNILISVDTIIKIIDNKIKNL